MYQQFFGLQTAPFSIAPDPNFLYLSERHQEALAHLTYGLEGSGGFTLLTGEVGTGKTTVSRALLERLPETTKVAFILNPMLNEFELLATLCDEFGIRYAKRAATPKQLTDKLSKFLLKAYAAGEQCLVIIDEAQHLQPQVLEQLRLLTNLETNQQKLLRVILIGQPELQTLLKRQELRQLAQRITARYHLLPLALADTKKYILYRLEVAGAQQGLFTDASLSRLHTASEGIPRRLNVLCDRALLAAYSERSQVVLPKHVQIAVREVDGELVSSTQLWSKRSKAYIYSSVFILLLVVGGWIGSVVAPKLVIHDPELEKPTDPVRDLLTLWQLPSPNKDVEVCDWVRQYELACWRGQLRLDQALALGYPLLLERQSGGYDLLQADTNVSAPSDWTGKILLIWQTPPGYYDTDSDVYQQWLQAVLSEALSTREVEQRLAADDERLLWRQMQQRAGLAVTGAVNAESVLWLTANYMQGGARLTSGSNGEDR